MKGGMSNNKQKSRRDTLRIATYICICIEIYLGWFDNLIILLITCTKLRYYNNDKRKRNSVLHVVRDGSLCAFLSRKLVTL